LASALFTEVKYKIPNELRTKPLAEVYENRHKFDDWLRGFLDSSVVVTAPTLVNIITPTPGDLIGINANLATLTQQIASIDARTRNVKIAKANSIAIAELSPLTPLLKETPGNGVALPGPGIVPFAPVPLLVGAAPAVPPFPANLNALNAFTHQQISDLSVLYNDTFGIVAGDNIATRRTKLQFWVSN
jgi:hypothetical protein